MKVSIFGIGNILIGDDGFGSRFAQLYKEELEAIQPGEIEVIDMGAHTIEAIDYLRDNPEIEHLYFIDVINIPKAQDEIIVMDKEELTNKPKSRIVMSNHSGGISEILETSEFMGSLPANIKLIGITPFNMETRMELSNEAKERLEKIKNFLVEDIKKSLSTS